MNDDGQLLQPEPADLRIWASLIEVATTASMGKQAVTLALIERWHDQIATAIRSLQREGAVDAGLDADRSAAALVAGIQGGAEILLATGDPSYLKAAIDDGIHALRTTRD
ncbi:TetR family transcriptional regulator C-terminal domain-containing protein [Mycobacterium sp. Aquia_216]|uniref:TetR family transcriptional regulator C-terminal domain-containing protein n=1 Tax=Mycobacterium sp. Aquia_216 TaxID=2991729 RepID=UPI00227B83E7|nr:TetR family transcriptional regulator C-terminal domain-containing protein [Mycobacterium sp. Aquia_216]WAJ46987.1 TetR family transcriptional regulator C-terminal domain-containing protein [Mycobacterium sp. Aquia_216]